LVLTVLVWLTAAATVLGGFPHVVCRCGPSPHESASTPDEQKGCCCCSMPTPPTGRCCAASDQAKPEQRSCCTAPAEPSDETDDCDDSSPAAESAVENGEDATAAIIAPAPCRRTLESAQHLAVDASLSPVVNQLTCQLFQANTIAVASSIPPVHPVHIGIL